MKIGYFADGPWSHRSFEKIVADPGFQIQFICVRFDTQDPRLRELGEKHRIPVLAHANVNSPEFLERIREFKCDLLVSMSFNQIFKKDILEVAPKGIINCHAGKLPFYRGRNILNWALINDEKEFGITVHFVDLGIDTGDIILQRTYPISETDDYGTLLESAYVGCSDILYDALRLMRENKNERKKQTEIDPLGFYCGMRKPGDEVINWNQNSRELFNFVRAICRPGPRATTSLGGKVVKINKASYFPDAKDYKGVPGQVLAKTENGFLVKAKDNFIEIREIESESKIKVGDRFE